jgi:hypothetical protein
MPQLHLRYKTCACGERIVLVPTVAVEGKPSKLMPLDVAPNDNGNVIVFQESGGRWVAQVRRRDTPDPIGTLMMPHFATCAARKPDRKRSDVEADAAARAAAAEATRGSP